MDSKQYDGSYVPEPPIGTQTLCTQCGSAIEWKGEHWDHVGDKKPRHIAIPASFQVPTGWGGNQGAAPVQPAWTKTLESREWSQVLHAIDHARNHSGAGAPGHGQFLLIAKLAKLLDERETHENG